MFDGERLAELRKDKGLGQKELAQILDVSAQNITRYETNVYAPTDEVKDKIVQYFGVSLDYLMGYIDEQIPYDRKDAIVLPQGFPPEAMPKVKEYIDLLMINRKATK